MADRNTILGAVTSFQDQVDMSKLTEMLDHFDGMFTEVLDSILKDKGDETKDQENVPDPTNALVAYLANGREAENVLAQSGNGEYTVALAYGILSLARDVGTKHGLTIGVSDES